MAGVPILYELVLSAAFLATMLAVLQSRASKWLGFTLGVPTILGFWVGYAFPEINTRPVVVGFHAVAAAFLLFTIAVVLREVYSKPTVTLDAIAGGLCGYLLIGLAFAHVYCLLADTTPPSFRGLDPGKSQDEIHFLLTYYSFSTLTTLGYGDITPARDTARSLAFTEAITGQFYLAVLIAELVGKRLAQAINPATVPVD
jgi:hypothetical protein